MRKMWGSHSHDGNALRPRNKETGKIRRVDVEAGRFAIGHHAAIGCSPGKSNSRKRAIDSAERLSRR